MKILEKLNKENLKTIISKSSNDERIKLIPTLLAFAVLMTSGITANKKRVEQEQINRAAILEQKEAKERERKQERELALIMEREEFENSYKGINELLKELSEKQEKEREQREIEMKSFVVREREVLTKEALDNLLDYLCGNNPFEIYFESKQEALDYLYENNEKSNEEKMLVIMARESLTFEQLDVICAGSIAEGGNHYEETKHVMSVLWNRSHKPSWIREYGASLFDQWTGQGQFVVYKHQDRKYYGHMELEGYQGAIDMLYSRKTLNNYLSFRSAGWDIQGQQFRPGGDIYFGYVNPDDLIESDYISVINKELEQDLEQIKNYPEKELLKEFKENKEEKTTEKKLVLTK